MVKDAGDYHRFTAHRARNTWFGTRSTRTKFRQASVLSGNAVSETNI